MPNERFTDLPVVSNANLTDIICAVQGYVSSGNPGISVQETLQQVFDLFKSNMVLYNSGNPNFAVAGETYQLCWDTVNHILYVCTTSGTSSTAVWTKSIALTAGTGISISQSGNVIEISSSGSGVGWNEVTTDTMTVSNAGYTTNSASLIHLTLPATSSYGDVIFVAGLGSGGWQITQGVGQSIIYGNVSSTVGSGGSMQSTNQYDCVHLYCAVPNLTWQVYVGPQGSPSVT
jgi:hypothetical protein